MTRHSQFLCTLYPTALSYVRYVPLHFLFNREREGGDKMGCDGGTIPRRDEMVKLKKKAEKVSGVVYRQL